MLKGLYRLVWLFLMGIFIVATISACNSNTLNKPNSTSTENCRIIQHAMGESCVPINPQRVVVLGGGLDTVLSLGVKPVGSVQVHRGDFYLKNRLEGIESVGSSDEGNFEAILALNPDLILGAEFGNSNYEVLSQIAPTVITEVQTSDDWKKMLNKYAEALGKTDKAEQIMADYHARIEKFQAQMGDRLSETEVSIVRIYQDRIQIYLEDSFPGTIVADAGLPRPTDQTNTEQTFSMDISKESLHMADGYVIFVWTFGSNEEIAQDDQTELKQLKADPLWSELNAVQQGKVYEVPGYWIGMGPIAADLVLDDLFKYLLPKS